MTRRPRVIYLIALWWWISFSGVMRATQNQLISGLQNGSVGPLISLLVMGSVVVFFWELVAILQMRPRPIWAFVIFLVLWSMGLVANLHDLLAQGGAVLAVVLVFLAINAAVVWYLTRPTFRALCVQYRGEREMEGRQRMAARALRKSLK